MKVLLAVPETMDELKDVWKRNWKKAVGAAVAAGGFIAGAVLTHGKLWGKDDADSDTDPTAGYLADGEENTEEDFSEPCPFENMDEEESNESEGDAE